MLVGVRIPSFRGIFLSGLLREDLLGLERGEGWRQKTRWGGGLSWGRDTVFTGLFICVDVEGRKGRVWC